VASASSITLIFVADFVAGGPIAPFGVFALLSSLVAMYALPLRKL
jgi:hypothetical protein